MEVYCFLRFMIGALKLNNLYSVVQKSGELNNLYASTGSAWQKAPINTPKKCGRRLPRRRRNRQTRQQGSKQFLSFC